MVESFVRGEVFPSGVEGEPESCVLHLLETTYGSLAYGVCWYWWVRQYRDYHCLEEVEFQLGVEVTEAVQLGDIGLRCCYSLCDVEGVSSVCD